MNEESRCISENSKGAVFLGHEQPEFQFLKLKPATSVKVLTFWNLHSIYFPTNGTAIWNSNKIFRMEPTLKHI